ncbi:hypothetical protein SCHPADRAFT_844661 [Schizopora paradoxa]|uniref:Uncharacterized protein n=1 Tax=Schizopora paradoxa TaxID=27342 RepID=A0A0H2S3T3_9AGAM|nr:hypothetical protein SCHPADRAFT_844661 [Schizopora paradoxa]
MHSPQSFSKLSETVAYTVQSSDVIEDLQIHVLEEGTQNIVWYKERFLSDDEIIENVVEQATSKLCWTIHRPKRGWYLRIKAPSFPRGASIHLSPVPKTSPFYVEGALTFQCRVNTPKSSKLEERTSVEKSSMESLTPTLTESSESTAHSYPPTPPFSPSDDALSKSPSLVPHGSSEVQQFILAPHSSPHVPHQETSSFLSRAFAAFKNNKPSHSLSFTLCPLPRNDRSNSQNTERPASPHCHSPSLSAIIPPSPDPLVTFHDRTPVWTFGSSTGLMEIDVALERETGVNRSFWVCIALAYMEFLTEREASILHGS